MVRAGFLRGRRTRSRTDDTRARTRGLTVNTRVSRHELLFGPLPRHGEQRLRTVPLWAAANGYTQRVMRLVAAATLVAFTLLVSIDRLCCPDGCTSSAEPVSTESVPHDVAHTCVLCVLGVQAPAIDLSFEPAAEASAGSPSIMTCPLVGTPLALDRPPRAA